MKSNTKDSFVFVEAACKAIDDKFGIDTMVLDISGISTMADYFIITSGSNPNQIKAIADAVEERLYKAGAKLNHTEGYQSSSWILLDYSNIIVHVFSKADREFYNLERVWGDAEKVQVELNSNN